MLGGRDMKFTKMHGLGNDYIYLNCMEDMPEDPASLARKLSDRHFGVGGDGLICVCPSQTGDFAMRMFNADGSEGEMCGNGIRCLGRYVYDKGLTSRTTLRIETLAGMRQVCLRLDQGEVIEATVDMGKPAVGASRTVFALGRSYRGTPASMGNPHFVVETEHLKSLDLAEVGPELERLPCFPGGTNVEFVRVRNPQELEMRVWERGSGETLACGTGACAAAAVMMAEGRVERLARVYLPGGSLEVEWSSSDGHMYMTGATVAVFDGELAD